MFENSRSAWQCSKVLIVLW